MEMERPNFVRNGGLKLPIGFRFLPTDEELVVHYLKRKVHSLPLPASVIPEFDIFRVNNPWDLPGDHELREKKYFFSRRRKGNENKKRNRNIIAGSGCGYWKVIGKEKHIVAQGSNQPLGKKRMFVFYQGKCPRGKRTSWIMREYRLLGSQTTQKQVVEMEDYWVVCCIYQKKRKAKNQNVEMIKSSSSCSSGITDQISSINGSDDDQEATSSFLCFSSYS